MQPKLVFLHIPKTGGTSMFKLLSQQFPPEAICPARHNDLGNYTSEELGRFTVFAGHYGFDTLELIPGAKVVVTMLREPTARLLSWYYFCRSHTWEHIRKHDPSIAPAKQYLLRDYLVKTGGIERSFIDQLGGSVKAAKANLRRMDAIGILEYPRWSMRKICRALELPMQPLPRENVRGSSYIDAPEPHQPISPEIRRLLLECTEQEREVYNFAKRLFFKQLVI